MNKRTDSMKLIFLIICLFGVCYLGYQVYAMSESRIQTEMVRSISVTQGITAEGVFFRDEQVIARESGGVCELMVGEWEKLAKNQEVAVVYSDGGDYEQSVEMRELEKKLDRLLKARDSSKEWSSPAAINSAIYNSIYQTVDMSLSGGLSELTAVGDELISGLLNRESYFSGNHAADDMIEKLQAEYNAMKRKPEGKRLSIKVPRPGLFSSAVDGYESVFTPEALLEATPEQFANLIEQKPLEIDESLFAGKLIEGNRWYFAMLLPAEDAKSLTQGGEYSINLNGSAAAVSAVLTRISRGDDKYLAVFSSEYDIQTIARVRKSECEIILRKYEGFRVPKRAVRIQDGVEGVYCLVGVQARFKPIVRLYEIENYYVCAADLSSVKQLFLYDEIIVTGKNLFDGKIVK